MQNIFFEAEGVLKHNPEIPDHFALFSIPKAFLIDLKNLEEVFEKYLFQLHPDFFSTESESQKTLSLKFSAIIKQAKDELNNPFTRAVYLLKTIYQSPSEQNLKQPQDFLMQMLEVREDLENKDAIENKEFILKLQKDYQNLLKELAKDFDEFIAAGNKQELFLPLAKKIGKIKYYINIQEKIDSL